MSILWVTKSELQISKVKLSMCKPWRHMEAWRLSSTHSLPQHQMDGPGLRSRYSDSLRDGRSRDQILVGARFSTSIQTSPGAHPASYTMGTGTLPGVKQPGHGVDHPTPYSAEVKERIELNLCSISGPLWLVIGWTLPFTFTSTRWRWGSASCQGHFATRGRASSTCWIGG